MRTRNRKSAGNWETVEWKLGHIQADVWGSAMYLSCAISPWWISPTHEAGRSGLRMKGWGHSGRNEVPPRRGWVQPFWMRSSDIRRESEVEPLLPGVWGSKLSWFAYLIWMPERWLPPVVYWVHPSGWMTKNHWCTDASWSSWSPCTEERESSAGVEAWETLPVSCTTDH